jgi:acyl-coenzyme A thioesterase PaaI-like protein
MAQDLTLADFRPITADNVEAAYQFIFAPWIKAMGLTDFKVSEGLCGARLPQNPALHWAAGAICGQAIMAAVDSVAALAVGTTERQGKGTAHQATQFLRPAFGEDLWVEARVLQWGKAIVYLECNVTFVGSGKLVAHSTLQFAF